MYAGTPADTQTNYLRDFLAFIGITDVEFVYAEGLAMGDVAKTEALSSAKNTIRKLTFAHGLAA
jgi:FMN-dependent NADH-azoreductase